MRISEILNQTQYFFDHLASDSVKMNKIGNIVARDKFFKGLERLGVWKCLTFYDQMTMNFCEKILLVEFLQLSKSDHGHLAKFLIGFWKLNLYFDNFLMASCCIWPIKMQGLWKAELSVVGKPTKCLTTVTVPLLVLTFDWPVKKEATGKLLNLCHKVVKTNQELCRVPPRLDVLDCNRMQPSTHVSRKKIPLLYLTKICMILSR